MSAPKPPEDTPRIEALLAQLSLEEKAALTAGSSIWYGTGIPRLDIPRLKLTDGPIGARGGNLAGGETSACFPNATALAATFSPELVEQVGVALGQEARTKHCHVLLGPTVNMHRSPLGGRHFESYSEDPFLTARLTVGFVRGVQSENVAVSVKHFVANDSEFERHTISSEVSERALREIYLVPFEAAVREASAWTIMGAYNSLNGTPCCAHRQLLHDILKDEWGFDGFVVTDWFALKDTEGPGAAGMDLEMPGPERHFGAALGQAVKDGRVPQAELDDKVRRILRIMERTGALDATEPEPPEQAIDRPEHRALARRVASEAIVLLRNDRDALPLQRSDLRRLAVIGPNAQLTSVQGGGSARVRPHYTSHVLDAIREACGTDVEIVHEPGCTSYKRLPILDGRQVRSGAGEEQTGFEARFFNGPSFSGSPVLERRLRTLDLTWFGDAGPGVDPADFCLELNGRWTPDEAGDHVFGLTCSGKARLLVNGEVVVDNWTQQTRGDSFFGTGTREETGTVTVNAGEAVDLRIEYTREGALGIPGLRVGHHPPIHADQMERAEGAAREADAAVVVVGLNADWETEGHDKADMELPGRQAELVQRIAAANPRTIVVVNAGAPLLLDCADDAPALLYAWYGGQEAGHAVADVLLGDVNPSGRLPTTFPRRMEDAPCHTEEPATYPGRDGVVRYDEDLWVGHRHYEAHGRSPRFAFGSGLSYTQFTLSDAHLSEPASDLSRPLEIEVSVTNDGARDGQEVVQVYVHPVEAPVPRPEQELKAFAKVLVPAGGRSGLRLQLDARAFSHWDPQSHDWVAAPGRYEIRVGRASDDLPIRLPFKLDP